MKLIGLICTLTLLATAQQVLNNESILKMTRAGFGESLILNMVQAQPGKYFTTPDDLVRLKQQGVSEKVLGAMLTRGSVTSATNATAITDTDIPAGLDVGLFYKKGGKWEELLPEVVNWKTGGVIKSIASAGIMKGDVNGHLPGAHSRNSVTSPLEVLVYAPEGVAITEYQLIRLRGQKESREFRTVTGGIMHVSGGATRDLMSFDGRKVSSRMYKVLLSNLGTGEYGFLPPGAFSSANSASSLGKMFSFRIVE